VNGRHEHPLYKELKKTRDSNGKAGRITWNFEKFLILPSGEVMRFRPRMEPDDPTIVSVIEANLPGRKLDGRLPTTDMIRVSAVRNDPPPASRSGRP
jgi:hypothetical protein